MSNLIKCRWIFHLQFLWLPTPRPGLFWCLFLLFLWVFHKMYSSSVLSKTQYVQITIELWTLLIYIFADRSQLNLLSSYNITIQTAASRAMVTRVPHTELAKKTFPCSTHDHTHFDKYVRFNILTIRSNTRKFQPAGLLLFLFTAL